MDLMCDLYSDFETHGGENFLRSCENIEDWRELFRCATEQGVDGVLLQAMLERGVQVPRDLLSSYGGRLASQGFLHRQLRAIEGRAARDLAAAGIRAVALHGPALGDRIGSIEVGRPAALQLSFLVSPRDHARALRLFSEYDGALIAVRCGFDNGLSDTRVEDILRRAVRYETETGGRLWIPSREDELILLATDAASRDFGRLGWLYDLKLFLESHCAMEPEGVLFRAEELGLGMVFQGILDLLGSCLGVCLDDLGTDSSPWPSVAGGPPLRQRVAWQLADDVLAEAVSASWGLRLHAQRTP